MRKLWYLYNARVFLHKIIHIYLPHMSSQVIFHFTQLTWYLVKWRSIKANDFTNQQLLRYLTFSSVRAVFCRSLHGFCSAADPRSSTTHLQCWASFQPFVGNFATTVQYPKPSFCNVSIQALSSYYILPITKVIGLTAIMTWNIEELITMLCCT